MERRRILIWGKTEPEFSKRYYETVCTGGVDEETGKLIRIYPITLRYMDSQYRKYQWISAPVERNFSDPRPESFKIAQDHIELGEHLTKGTKPLWEERRKWILGRPENVFESVEALRNAQQAQGTSLGLVKPLRIRRFYPKRRSPQERAEWEEAREEALRQRDLYVDPETKTRDLTFMPVRYYCEFESGNDSDPTVHKMSILDWEVCALGRRQYATRNGNVAQVEKDVIGKLEQLTDDQKRDCYFFLGNTKAHPQSFMIVGLFTPPKGPAPSRQMALGI